MASGVLRPPSSTTKTAYHPFAHGQQPCGERGHSYALRSSTHLLHSEDEHGARLAPGPGCDYWLGAVACVVATLAAHVGVCRGGG